MRVNVRCSNPACGQPLQAPAGRSGATLRCGHCGHETVMVSPAPAAAARVTARPAASRQGAAAAESSPAGATGGALPSRVGPFEVRGLLGVGAFGTVYRAHDRQLDREIALKVPRSGTLDNSQAMKRFQREARAAARLQHPHIVPVYDTGQDGDRHYIASAFIEGQPLARVIANERLDFRRAAQVVHDLAGALAYAHGLGIVHRDVKPANVMLDPQGEAHLMDFGLAYLQEESEKLTQDGAVLGTPAYMAPEQAKGQQGAALPAGDQYGLGVVLYELLCGRPPFEGPPQIVLFNAVHGTPPSPRTLRGEVPLDLETICLKAMAKHPEERYPSCQEMADDLRRWLEGEPIRARRQGVVERLVRWCRRERLLAGAGAAAVACLIAATVVATLGAARLSVRVQGETEARQLAEAGQRQETEAREQAEAAAQKEAEAHRNAEDQKRETEEAIKQLQEGEREDELAARNEQDQADETRAARRDLEERLKTAEAIRRKADEERKNREQAEQATRTLPLQAIALGGKSESNVVFTPDRNWVAVGVGDSVTLWDPATPQKPAQQRSLFKPVVALALSPDGKSVVASARDGTFKRMSLDQKEIGGKEGNGTVTGGSFSPDGRRVLVVVDGAVRLLDVTSFAAVDSFKWDDTKARGAWFSPDGKRVAVVTADGRVRLLEASTGRESLALPKEAGQVVEVVFSPDGRRLATVGDGAKVWDAAGGKQLYPLAGQARVAFSPDGKWVVTAADADLTVWHAETGEKVRSFRAHDQEITAVAFSGDGKMIATVGKDDKLKIWDAALLEVKAEPAALAAGK